MKFSVLMSVYYKETQHRFKKCVESILSSTLLPDQIVVVMDGPQNVEVVSYLEYLKTDVRFNIVGYADNMGLGYALNFGLKFVKHEYVMRMDTDDLVLPDRFQLQIEFMKNKGLDISSGHIREFEDIDSGVSIGSRNVPIGPKRIDRTFPWKSPFNHMAVCFRKSAIIDINGYEVVDLYEDYYLWWKAYRVLKYDNLDKILVHATFDLDQLKRRIGLSILIRELRFQTKCFKIHKNVFFFFIGLFRVFVRILPARLMKIIYLKLLRWK